MVTARPPHWSQLRKIPPLCRMVRKEVLQVGQFAITEKINQSPFAA
jgi:hypothetical protein